MKRKLILLIGPIGSGKSTLAKRYQGIEQKSYSAIPCTIVSQDEQGRKGHRVKFNKCLEDGHSIIVDRMNFNKEQRDRYIEPAKQAGYTIYIVEVKTDRATCLERVVARENHPTIEKGNKDLANKILDMYYREYEPLSTEYFDGYTEVTND